MAELGWSWDPSLYGGSAAYYARGGRVPYPAGLAAAVAAAEGLDGSGRLLDVGCGPGSLTLLLAPLFAEVTGIDADPDMLAEAARLAAGAEPEVTNVTWRQLRGEDLPADLGTYRMVTFAQSFHWLDRPRVAAAVHGMLDDGGTCVHVHATTHEGTATDRALAHPQPPREAIAELVRRYLGPTRRAGLGALPGGTASGEDAIYRGAGFLGPDRLTIPGRVVARTADDVVASVFSLSSSAPQLFGGRLAAFEAELRQLVAGASRTGLFSEYHREIAVDLWRPDRVRGRE